MSRTESISIQVHPNDEQSQINLMQKFHWSLLNSQEIKTVDSHLERRGDDIYSVTNSEHYTKLTFSRPMELPNISEIKKLEQEFFALKNPANPTLFPISFWLWLIAAFFYGIGIIGWLAYFFLGYKPKEEAAAKLRAENDIKRDEIFSTLIQYG